jgi:tetratricopeptide (TPR) repeat protein
MSKRPNQDPLTSESKRAKSTNKHGHAAECSDKLCQGCDVGEVEITFKDTDGQTTTIVPPAQVLLAMAIEEASKDRQNDNDDENNGYARRLFDMAIEKYQKDEPENRVGYAICLIELGRTVAVQESISEGLEILRGEIKKNNNEQVSIELARAAIALAISIRKEQDAYFEQQEKELDEDDEIALGELLEKQQVDKKEIKLYQEALEHTRDVFRRLGKNESLIEQAQLILGEFRTYGQLLVQPFHKEHANIVLDAAIELIQKVPEFEKNDELLLTWAACLLHKERFVEEEKEKLIMYKKIDELLTKSNKLHVIKNDKENHFVWEMVKIFILTFVCYFFN